MACRGVYFALSDDDAKRVLDDETLIEVVQGEIEAKWDSDWVQEADKSWDAIHRCLTDGTLRCRGKSTLERFVLGGKSLHRAADSIVSYMTPEEVRDVAEASRKITKDFFRERYFRLKKTFLGMDFTDYAGPLNETDFEYSWSYFEDIRRFFEKAAAAGRHVIFTVDP